ncbi:hypothetical protein MVEN_00038500 [Mycena venus]|uniref:Retrotransposon gag domain-containing protein n=1 Tax=Mycena venus TaxID=2733690 RepID=A0A8H7DGX5_9AGAR|nr:hypothetical protein MVEN_00038500 [Mycena venus]
MLVLAGSRIASGTATLRQRKFFSDDDSDPPSPLSSADSLPSLTEYLSELTLGPKKAPRKGQFGYKEPSLPSSSPSLTLSDLSDFWDQLPGHSLSTPPTSPLLGPTIATTITAVDSDSDDETVMPSDFFWGDGRDADMVPGDYLKLTMNKFKEASSDDFKAERLSNGFATNSKAELWYKGLDAATIGDWKLLKAAFLKQWPRETVPALSVEQHRARLRAEKLRKEDIGKVVYVKGIDMTGHVAWANRILALSANADDPSGAMIHEIREGMPAVMKKMVTGTFKTWKDFCDAVKGVDDDTIAVTVADESRLDQVETPPSA